MIYRAAPKDGVAWVTGASSGIGKAVTLELARRGYTVAATARRHEELAVLAQKAEPLAGRIVAYEGDVTDEAAMAGIVRAIEQAQGPIALAFLNAGIAPYTRAGDFDVSAFAKAHAVNVMGVVNGLAPLFAVMGARGWGQIGVTASVAGYGGLPRAAAYGASKAAVIHLCEALKYDCDLLGINLQVVNPGFVKTPLTAKNDFPMPTAIGEDEAARRICDGFETAGFEIAFPRRLAWTLKLVNLLPYRLYFPLIARATGWNRQAAAAEPPKTRQA